MGEGTLRFGQKERRRKLNWKIKRKCNTGRERGGKDREFR